MSINKTIVSFPEDHDRNAFNLEQVLPQIKDMLIGKQLNKILNKTVWDTEFDDEDIFVSYDNIHNVFFEDFEFVIGDDVLQVDIYGPSYRVELNNTEIETIYPTENILFKNWADCNYKPTSEYKDISYIWSFLIGQRVIDISLEFDIYEEDGKEVHDLEAFIIHLSNGQKIKVSNQLDNPYIEII